MLTLPLATARGLMLSAQGLLTPPTKPAVKADVLAAIRRMGVLQIDTIHVVARSPYLTLFSRLGDYDPRWLDELLAEKALFEYWAHAACFIPSEDFPLFRRFMLSKTHFWHSSEEWTEKHPDAIRLVMDVIREKGETRSADFERTDGRSGGWWDWKIEKTTLEILLDTGKVMIARRHNFQRIYDLTERVKPDWDDADTPAIDEVYRRLLVKTARCLGVMRADWAADYFRLPKRECPALLKELVESGELIQVEVEGWKVPAYLHPETLPLLESDLIPAVTAILSPFDPLVWDRARAKALFDFDYTIECYTPAAKRLYGYFTLPILHRGAFIGRLEAKAHRVDKLFEVRGLFFEKGVNPEAVRPELEAAVQRLADWHKTPEVVYPNYPAILLES
ncbi:MAG: winged helix-turn-helix domain-containing protein [Anaerolineaceae bacterium]